MDSRVPSELASDLQKAFKQYAAANEDWKAAVLHLAETLAHARVFFPSNQAFGAWLADNDLDDLGRDDRAALIGMGEHLDVTRVVLETTTRRSPRLIWLEEVEPRVRSAANTAPTANSPVDSAESASECPQFATPADLAGAMTTATSALEAPDMANMPSRQGDNRARRRSPMRILPHGELVLRHVLHESTRKTLNKYISFKRSAGGPVWDLLVTAIESGAFGPPSDASVNTPNLRLILPWAPVAYAQRFDVSEKESRAKILADVIPVVLEHLEQLRREPQQLPVLVSAAVMAKVDADRARREAERRAAAIAALPEGTSEITMYGFQFWPWAETMTAPWTYGEAAEAAWVFETAQPFLAKMNITPHEQATFINILLRWTPMRNTGWAEALRRIGLAYEKNPAARCLTPMRPVNYGM